MTSLSLPDVIDIRLLGTCDLRCPFCYGPRHEEKQLDLDVVLNALERFSIAGVRQIVVTGGEPLLVSCLPKILQRAKRLNIGTTVSTNGNLLSERIEAIGPWLDWIGLPLDGDTPDINSLMRVGRSDHFETTLANLKLVKTAFPGMRIKLGTVACALNKNGVPGIPRVLARTALPDVWKLYQVAYHSYGADNQSLLALSDAEFDVLARESANQAATMGMMFVAAPRASGNQIHLFMTPNADAVVVMNDIYTPIGNFATSFELVLRRWRKYLDPEAIRKNFDRTYPNSRQGFNSDTRGLNTLAGDHFCLESELAL